MKKKICELRHGDVVEICKKCFDVYGDPIKVEDDVYLFVIVNHGDLNKIKDISYVTPVDLAYEISSNYENDEIDVITEG